MYYVTGSGLHPELTQFDLFWKRAQETGSSRGPSLQLLASWNPARSRSNFSLAHASILRTHCALADTHPPNRKQSCSCSCFPVGDLIRQHSAQLESSAQLERSAPAATLLYCQRLQNDDPIAVPEAPALSTLPCDASMHLANRHRLISTVAPIGVK